MFQRLKDAFVFEREFSRWEQLSDIRTLLIGNRVAEMHGQSASYDQELDVYKLRELYSRHRDSFIKHSKQNGLSSQQAVLNFICKIGHLYIDEERISSPPEGILFSLSLLAPSYSPARSLLDERWRRWLENSEAAAKVVRDEVRAFLPKLHAARKEASLLFEERHKAICERDIYPDIRLIWRAIPNKTQETERMISENSGLPLADCISWIEALRRNGVVTIIGTALDEPKFWKTPLSTLNEPEKRLRNFLDTEFS